ncbi:SflA family class IV lanthipeptide [Streptomyces achromogenes]|uniref:SflA family class IV lanthipeptide n=1 Tax=Streptomyces achromogenes TaxID=67255 RepID=UPI0036FA8E01
MPVAVPELLETDELRDADSLEIDDEAILFEDDDRGDREPVACLAAPWVAAARFACDLNS